MALYAYKNFLKNILTTSTTYKDYQIYQIIKTLIKYLNYLCPKEMINKIYMIKNNSSEEALVKLNKIITLIDNISIL